MTNAPHADHPTLALPPFLWGSATAAAQVEGAAHEDGKGDSIWDAFARVPGAIANGDDLEIAVDHYHRTTSDIAIMNELGLDAYRFSTSWARIAPDGRSINRAGLDFYSRLVDQLLETGILPWLTLYHWDLPQALEEHGGWTNRDTALRFVDYAETTYAALGDRVQHWTTFNEPFCSALLGYAVGVHAPGRRDEAAALAAVHHQHLAHGLATTRLRELGAQQIGITLNLTNAIPANPADPADVDAARRVDGIMNRLFLEPIVLGAYPADVVEDLAGLGLDTLVHDGDLATIAAPIDFLGVNHYHDDLVSGHPDDSGADGGHSGATEREAGSPWLGSPGISFPSRELPRTAMDWEVHPAGLRTLLVRLGREYPTLPPLYVTENGAAYDDVAAEDGRIHDVDRDAFIQDHIDQVELAIADGADVRGYFVWSLLDNFEWAYGYDKRFGIVRVDYQTQERTIKDSGLAYARRIAASREGSRPGR
ncbi:beta-glucosidase [Plantibacter flavus]|uniref:GH1 family beta-glucosidase n=1 Tax=Plantibacter flavus TaxID=150123 RepID=UPI003F18CCEF